MTLCFVLSDLLQIECRLEDWETARFICSNELQ